jgi:hypothetical protein
MVIGCWPRVKPPSSRTTSSRLSAITCSTHSQLSPIFEGRLIHTQPEDEPCLVTRDLCNMDTCHFTMKKQMTLVVAINFGGNIEIIRKAQLFLMMSLPLYLSSLANLRLTSCPSIKILCAVFCPKLSRLFWKQRCECVSAGIMKKGYNILVYIYVF